MRDLMPKLFHWPLAYLRSASAGPFLTPCSKCKAADTMCGDCEALASSSAYRDIPMRWPDGREEWPQRS